MVGWFTLSVIVRIDDKAILLATFVEFVTGQNIELILTVSLAGYGLSFFAAVHKVVTTGS